MSKYAARQSPTPRMAPLTAAIGGILATATVEATTITVTTLSDANLGFECTLRSALEAVTTNTPVNACPAGTKGIDEIVFESSLSGDLQLVQGALVTGGGFIIDGDDRIVVRGTDNDRVFFVRGDLSTGPVGFLNITITEGNYDGNGGGISSSVSYLNLTNVDLVNNKAHRGGGLNAGGTLVIEDSLISGNEASAVGGGIHIRYGSHLYLTNVDLIDNKAENQGGGLSWFNGREGTLTIHNSLVSGNEARSGGGIHATSSNDLVLTNVTLINNTALRRGGGLGTEDHYGTLAIQDSQVSGNKAMGDQAGGIYFDGYRGGNLELYDNVISYNESIIGGSGVFAIVRGSAQDNSGSAVVEGNVFLGNSVGGGSVDTTELVHPAGLPFPGGGGGGIGIHSYNANPVIVRENHFENNYAIGDGGGAWLRLRSGSSSTDPDFLIEIGPGNHFEGNQAASKGGGLLLIADDEVSIALSEATFEGNMAAAEGGGAHLELASSVISISGVDLIDNEAQAGGGISISGGYIIYLDDLMAQGNESVDSGGGLKIDGEAIVELSDSRFVDNSSLTACGGGVAFQGESPFIGLFSSIFRANSSADCGGAVAFDGWESADAAIVIVQSEFSGNTEDGGRGGGAILADINSGGSMIMSNATLSGNSTLHRGGAVKVMGDSLTLSVAYSTFAYNHASSRGGGIDATGPCFRVGNSLFAANTYGSAMEPQELYAPDCPVEYSLITSAVNSVFESDETVILNEDPLILPLADNGGNNGHTHALQAGSPAIDAGNAGFLAPPFDQRGAPFTRIFGAAVDMGAYEFRMDSVFADRFEN
jgi:hypothetical protein